MFVIKRIVKLLNYIQISYLKVFLNVGLGINNQWFQWFRSSFIISVYFHLKFKFPCKPCFNDQTNENEICLFNMTWILEKLNRHGWQIKILIYSKLLLLICIPHIFNYSVIWINGVCKNEPLYKIINQRSPGTVLKCLSHTKPKSFKYSHVFDRES